MSQTPPKKTTKRGIIPNEKQLPKIGSGRGRPAKGYNQKIGQWEQRTN